MDPGTGVMLTTIALVGIVSYLNKRWNRRQAEKDNIFGTLGFSREGFNDYRHRIGGASIRVMDRGVNGIELTVGSAIPSTFEITAGRSDSPLGDPELDRIGSSSGDRATALAHLTVGARAALVKAIKEGWRLTARGLECSIGRPTSEALVELIARGKGYLDAVAAGRPKSISEGLLARVKDDPLPTIRLAALEALTTHFEANLARPSLEPALAMAIEDSDPDVRLFAGLRTKNPRVIASVALSSAASDEARARAASVLFDEFADDPNTEDLCDKLNWYLAGDDGPTWPTTGVAAIIGSLGPHLARPDVRDLVEGALGAEANPIQLAAIDVLERAAGLWAVALLLPLREEGIFGQVRTAARQAITAIQAREAGPVGALALSSGETGGLAVVNEAEESSR